MSISKSRRERRNKNLKIIGVCILFFGIGYFILNNISNSIEPPLGNTFYILLGCIMMAVSGLFFVVTVRQQFFPKKRQRTNHVFLEDQKNDTKT